MQSWVEDTLACPRDGVSLSLKGDVLKCPEGHEYPLILGVPVMLIDEAPPTHGAIRETLNQVTGELGYPEIGDPQETRQFVQDMLGATCGHMYQHVKSLQDYPIPRFPLSPEFAGATLIDIGSNWGRWSFSAARKGFRVVAVDPSLRSALAGKEIARQIGLPVSFIVGDARFLPFKSRTFDVAFSYSVLQHFSKSDAQLAIDEASRVLRPDRTILVQMANGRGLRQLFNRLRQQVKADTNPFRVRYWTIRELNAVFEQIGKTSISADGYLSLNAQISDIDILPRRYGFLIRFSEALKGVAARRPILTEFADSLWVMSRKRAQDGTPGSPPET
ncbi:MAG: methyltransferase domain-containing protein [Actinobacteria bacterium]|nr:methyltransferase domain-containing protein [Actinomycetota bacterium]